MFNFAHPLLHTVWSQAGRGRMEISDLYGLLVQPLGATESVIMKSTIEHNITSMRGYARNSLESGWSSENTVIHYCRASTGVAEWRTLRRGIERDSCQWDGRNSDVHGVHPEMTSKTAIGSRHTWIVLALFNQSRFLNNGWNLVEDRSQQRFEGRTRKSGS